MAADRAPDVDTGGAEASGATLHRVPAGALPFNRGREAERFRIRPTGNDVP